MSAIRVNQNSVEAEASARPAQARQGRHAKRKCGHYELIGVDGDRQLMGQYDCCLLTSLTIDH